MQDLLLVVCLFGIGMILRNQNRVIKNLRNEVESLKNEYFRGFTDGKKAALESEIENE